MNDEQQDGKGTEADQENKMQSDASLNDRKELKLKGTKKIMMSKQAGEQMTAIEIKGEKPMYKSITKMVEPELRQMLTSKHKPAALDELDIKSAQLKRESARLRGGQKKRTGDALALRAEAGRVGARLNPLCAVDASGRIVRGGYVVPRIVDPRPSIRPVGDGSLALPCDDATVAGQPPRTPHP